VSSKLRPRPDCEVDLVVDDLSRLLAESDSVNITRFGRYAGQWWWKTLCIRVVTL